MSLLAARHLAKKYGARHVVRDVSISVNSGEVVGLLGPNGAGKTTSFYMIIGLVACDEGSVHLNRRDLTRSSTCGLGNCGSAYYEKFSKGGQPCRDFQCPTRTHMED